VSDTDFDIEGKDSGQIYTYLVGSGNVLIERRLSPATSIEDGRFGVYVSLSDGGNYVVAGVQRDHGNADNTYPPLAPGAFGTRGVAYVFDLTDSSRATVRPETVKDGMYFGRSVSINSTGSLLVVGARGEDEYIGAVYVYTRLSIGNTWAQTQKIEHPDRAQGGTYLGDVVHVSNNRLFIGAVNAFNNAGRVYVYRLNSGDDTFTYETTLGATCGTFSGFGAAVASDLEGNTVVVGIPNESSGTETEFVEFPETPPIPDNLVFETGSVQYFELGEEVLPF